MILTDPKEEEKKVEAAAKKAVLYGRYDVNCTIKYFIENRPKLHRKQTFSYFLNKQKSQRAFVLLLLNEKLSIGILTLESVLYLIVRNLPPKPATNEIIFIRLYVRTDVRIIPKILQGYLYGKFEES